MKTSKEQFKTIQVHETPVTVGPFWCDDNQTKGTSTHREVYLLIENELIGDTVITLSSEQAHKLAGALHSYAAQLEIENNN